ncbi:MAG: DUF2510 domain-containing protein [Coriobacteriales bacterium]|jgi:hypothetical protein|nr:DUF2510 domain-containing protein [Coriobacteriales bacterium]
MESPAGWYPDPLGDAVTVRYWDGQAWTERTQTLISIERMGAAIAPPFVLATNYQGNTVQDDSADDVAADDAATDGDSATADLALGDVTTADSATAESALGDSAADGAADEVEAAVEAEVEADSATKTLSADGLSADASTTNSRPFSASLEPIYAPGQELPPLSANPQRDPERASYAIAGLITGIFSLLLIPVVSFAALPAILAIVLGVLGIKSTRKEFAVCALVLGIATLLLGAIALAFNLGDSLIT